MLYFVYFKKLLNELVGKYSPSKKVFKNLNKYTVDALIPLLRFWSRKSFY